MSIRKTIVSALKDGTSKLTITEDKFKNYRIEYIPISEQIKRKNKVKQNKEEIAELKRKQEDLENKLYLF